MLIGRNSNVDQRDSPTYRGQPADNAVYGHHNFQGRLDGMKLSVPDSVDMEVGVTSRRYCRAFMPEIGESHISHEQ